MKTYKLEEIVKMVRENPKLKIESNMSVAEYCEHRFTPDFINADFRIKQEAVTFMEAANSGKEIKPAGDKFKEYAILKHWLGVFTWGSVEMELELLNGKWYIQEE